MTDPQQPPLPPYAANPAQPPQFGGHPGAAAPTHQQPYYAPHTPQPAPGSTATNTPGRIGLIAGLVGLGISLMTTAAVQILIRSASTLDFSYAIVSIIGGIGAFLAFAAAALALVLGIVGIRKSGAPHAQAGIATGLGIAGVVGGIFTFLLSVTAPFFY